MVPVNLIFFSLFSAGVHSHVVDVFGQYFEKVGLSQSEYRHDDSSRDIEYLENVYCQGIIMLSDWGIFTFKDHYSAASKEVKVVKEDPLN